jgi:hypothetical protein
MKLVLDSLDYAWIESYFGIPLGDDTTEAFEFDNWHQPVSPLLIWDEIHWLQQGEFVLTEWRRPDADSGLVDTEYVRILYYVSVEDYRDINGDTEVSLGDYLLLKFLGPLKLGETVWYRVDRIGLSQPDDSVWINIIKPAIPPPLALCACDCFGNPQCDLVIVDVFDVVLAVDVAFRAGAPIIDPNPACPREDTDVTCDNVTNVFDVVLFVDVAFRSGDPNVLFCDPCL